MCGISCPRFKHRNKLRNRSAHEFISTNLFNENSKPELLSNFSSLYHASFRVHVWCVKHTNKPKLFVSTYVCVTLIVQNWSSAKYFALFRQISHVASFSVVVRDLHSSGPSYGRPCPVIPCHETVGYSQISATCNRSRSRLWSSVFL